MFCEQTSLLPPFDPKHLHRYSIGESGISRNVPVLQVSTVPEQVPFTGGGGATHVKLDETEELHPLALQACTHQP